MKKYYLIISLAMTFLMMSMIACSSSSTPTQTASATTTFSPSVTASTPSPTISPSVNKIGTIRLVGTIGPLTIPLAYMQQNNVLASIANQTTLTIWATPTQLQAIITGGQGDFIELPTNSAATFYNKGVPLKMLDASIWNILYLVTADTSIKSVTDLKGKTVAVPYQGAIPDAMFRYICQKQGVNPDTDINIAYSSDPVQASKLLLSGQEKYVLLSEPSATSVILQGQANGTNFIRVLNMQTEWKKTVSGDTSTPIAGTVVLGALANRPDIINTFNTEYQKAIQWMLANPVEAGNAGAKALTEQGFSAAVLTESMKNIDWHYVSAQDARKDIEAFFNVLSQVSPNYIGGKLPDDGFSYKP